MLRQLMLAKKIEQRQGTLAELLEQEEGFVTRGEELEEALRQAENDEELDLVEEKIAELEEEKEELAEKKSKLEEEIMAMEAELEEIKSKEPDNTKRSKGVEGMNEMELREAIDRFIRTKGQKRDDGVEGFKVVDGGVLVPEGLEPATRLKEDTYNLAQYVRTVKVNNGAGKLPIIKKSGGRMVTVAELEANPELAKPEIDDVAYDIKTYRGYVPISQEVIDDAAFDVVGLIAEDIKDQELNTKNEIIADLLKEATPKTAEGLDGLKGILNKELKQVYNVKLFVTASLYNELDTVKDRNGRYLLQDSITSASGKQFAGKEVIVLDDDVLGDGDTNLNAFIGDAYEFIVLFDRKQATAKWIDHNIYGQLLAAFVRFDAVEVDKDAGFYVTYEPEEEGN